MKVSMNVYFHSLGEKCQDLDKILRAKFSEKTDFVIAEFLAKILKTYQIISGRPCRLRKSLVFRK